MLHDFSYRYATPDGRRRLMTAVVHWGPGADKTWEVDTWTCNSRALPSFNYARAATTTIVIGHLLASMTKRIRQPDQTEDFKVFCVGHSLGGHVCGFSGKEYR